MWVAIELSTNYRVYVGSYRAIYYRGTAHLFITNARREANHFYVIHLVYEKMFKKHNVDERSLLRILDYFCMRRAKLAQYFLSQSDIFFSIIKTNIGIGM